MCGIAGFITTKKAELHSIKTMTDAIAHRGPDGEGHYLYENTAIGHRRLSIIDLDTGHQPMCNEKETVWITYNGELYNYIELRNILKAKGHRFRTKSDTEVIIHAYEQWGTKCLNRFRGMFAFCIMDLRKKCFFLARDPFGIKPLVYYKKQDTFVFASEIQAIKALSDLNLDISLQAIDQYLFLQYIPAPLTAFKNIFKLPPAHYMLVNFSAKIIRIDKYRQSEFNSDYKKDEPYWYDLVNQTLKQSVEKHLISDVPFGAFLSGGIDSTLTVGYMADYLNNPVKTFSIGFKEKEFNELEYSHIAARKNKTNHYTEIVEPDAIDILPKLVKHYGEPFGDSSALPTYYVSQLAAKYVTMLISGDGGDEFFAGYNSYHKWKRFIENNKYEVNPKWKEKLYPLAHKIYPKRYPLELPQNRIDLWYNCIRYAPLSLRKKLWRNEFQYLASNDIPIFNKEFKRAKKYSDIHKVQHLDIHTYLPYDILTKVDIASMMHSIEVRPPIVDIEVFRIASQIPEKYNFQQIDATTYNGKILLKKKIENKYSYDFAYRKKTGFAIPLQKWFKSDGELNEYIHDRLLSKSSLLNNYFNPKTINDIIKNNSSGVIWLLLFLDEWLIQNK